MDCRMHELWAAEECTKDSKSLISLSKDADEYALGGGNQRQVATGSPLVCTRLW
jgi:hypothetical protein